MKKTVIKVLAAAAMIAVFCPGTRAAAEDNTAPMQIIATVFPEYDWVRSLLGDNPAGAELTMLLDSGTDLHSFQPTAEDIMAIANCDFFIYIGGESDSWVDNALKEAANPDMVVLNLMDELGEQVKEEELAEGMEAEEEEEGEDDGEEETEYDEHIWLSLRNASKACEVIAGSLAEIDPDHASVYADNLAAYQEKLAALDGSYQDVIDAAPVRTLLFGDRFPFRYLADDYELTYYAAFAGCSAETEASFETIIFLAQKVDELGLNCVCTIEGSDQRLARTIVETTETKDQEILTFNSMQSMTQQDVEDGAGHLAVMEDHLAVLEEALQ